MGAYAGVKAGLPVLGCLLLAVVGPTAGRYYIDITSGVSPKQFIRGEWFVAIAFLTGLVWILATDAGASPWFAAGISFLIGFIVRMIALYRAWEEPLSQANRQASTSTTTAGRCWVASSRASRSASCTISASDEQQVQGSHQP